jgi:hypothetical protein
MSAAVPIRPLVFGRMAVVLACTIIAGPPACARYEVARDQLPPCEEPPPPALLPDSTSMGRADAFAGRVLSAETGEPLAHAVVAYGLVGAGADAWRHVRTDTAGRFEAPLAAPGRYEVRTLYVGFVRRVDVLDLSHTPDRAVQLRMARPMCGDIEVVVLQRKPWWKFW